MCIGGTYDIYDAWTCGAGNCAHCKASLLCMDPRVCTAANLSGVVDLQGVAQLLRNLTPLVQQGNLREQLEDVIEDKYTNEVSSP